MGTINYKANKFITVGENTNDYENIIDDILYADILKLFKKYDFTHFNISIQPGYYDGFYIDFEFNYLYFDDYIEKQEALKEITLYKKLLLDCVKLGLVAVHPGWCTTYFNYQESIEKINQGIKELKEYIRKYPTYRSYRKVVK